ncbi:MAG: hypothetical protein AAB538_04440 [Patescibacteria group bacterium]
MGLLGDFFGGWFGGGRRATSKGDKIIQDAVDKAEEHAGFLGRAVGGTYNTGQWKRAYRDQVTKQDVNRFDSRLEQDHKKDEREWGIYRSKTVDRIGREIGLDSVEGQLSHAQERLRHAKPGQVQQYQKEVDRLIDKKGSLTRQKDRRVKELDWSRTKSLDRRHFQEREQRQDIWDTGSERFSKDFKSGREQAEAQEELNEAMQRQSQAGQWGARGGGVRPLGRRDGLGPQQGGGGRSGRPTFTNSGR